MLPESVRAASLLAATIPVLVGTVGCAAGAGVPVGPVAFDTATAWVHDGADSIPILVEVARTVAQQEVGLAGRGVLDQDSGMLFEFETPRTAEDGFWMWGTAMALDVAFLDEDGVILQVIGMDRCTVDDRDACPGYFPDTGYSAAIEVNRGWFARNGIEVGDRVRVER